MKRHKDSDAPSKNDDAQVFVLPPDLLEQLGIQLSNITGSLTERSVEGQYYNDNSKDMPGTGSSILETANLMKQSVFMSPTFVSTTATESLNQLNNMSNIVTETYESNDIKLHVVNNVADIENTDRIEFSNIDINPSYNKQSENFMKYQAIDEYEVKNENGDMILTNESYGTCNNVNIDQSMSGNFDDHADEAYLSDGSTSNSEPCSKIMNNNLEAVTKLLKPCNKIKILSEQIINHSDLNTIQSSHIQKSSSCFLIPVDTIVTGKPMKESTSNQLIQKIVQVNDKINDDKEKNNITNIMETPIKKNAKIQNSSSVNQRIEKIAQEELITTLEKKIKINDENEKKNINGKKDITNSTNTVIKITALVGDSLSVTHPGVTKEKTNKSIGILENGDENKVIYIRDINKDKKPKVKSMIDITKEIISNTEKSSSKSKLCIQGVEKPGGTLKFNTDTVLKTYQRTNIRKYIPELLHIDKTDIVDFSILPEVEIGLDNIYMSGYKHANKFCICSDFGQMANYESDIAYEHIHFCGHNSVGCTLETLFSMYNDNLGLHELDAAADFNVANDEDVIETQQNICWWSYVCENNDETEEVAIYESRTTDQTNSSPDQPRRSNRKRKSTATEHITESVDFKSRRTIKCGACDLILSEAEWNKHKDSEHDLIAWKDGQTIVQNDPSTIGNKTTSKCDIEKKVLTPEPTRRTRRTSRNSNGRCDVSKLNADNTCKKVNHVDASSIQIQKSKSLETDIRSQSITGVQINTPSISQKKHIETSLNLEEAVTPKSIKKSKNNRKASDFEDSSKPRSVISCSKREVDSEKPTRCTRLSKTFEDTPKSTVIEITPKSTKSSIDCSPKTKKIKDTPKEETKISPKSSRKSIDVSTNAAEIKKIKSIQKSVNVEITTKTNLALDVQATLKTIKKPIGDVSHPEPTECNNILSKSTLACTAKSNSVSIDAFSKTTRNTVEAIEVSPKATVKSMQIATSKRQLKEIDIFSSPAKKNTNIDSQSSKKSMDVTNATKLANVKLTSKSTKCSTDDVTSKLISLESKYSNKQSRESSLNINRKIVDAGLRCDDDVSSTLNLKFVDAHLSSKTLRKYTRSKSSKETTKTLTSTPSSKETKISYTPTKSETKSDLSSSTKRSSDITKSENISFNSEKVDNLKSRRKTNIINSQVQVNLSQTPTSVKTLAVRTASADKDTTSTSNTQETVDASSSSNNGNNIAHACLKGKSITTSDDANEPPNEPDEIFVVSIKEEVLPRCAVCKQQVEESLWLEHIAKEHNYLAWREDETPLDLQDDEEIRAHLYGIVKTNGGLRCYKCNVTRKYVKSYLAHIRSCNGDEEEQSEMDVSTASADINTTQDPDDLPLRPKPRSSTALPCLQRSVVCGVCSETILENKWIDHIRMEHKYLAWKNGEPPLDVNDEVAVKVFLQNISKYNGGLICSKCGAIRSYVKKWMDHEATCMANEPSSSDILNESNKSGRYIEIEIATRIVKCAKCSKEMPSEMWIDHIEKEHTYLSWIEGQPPLEENDPEAVSAYLHALVKKRGTLYCVKCGVTRKYPKAFLTHVNACEMSGFKREDYYVEVSGQIKPDEFECAVCHETGNRKDWKKHAMEKHYNVAWIAGEIPINLKNPYAVEKYLKEYRTKHKLVCKVCGSTRASCYGFYAHILTCGKAENEIEHLMEMCDICNNTYLCIYRNQHKAMHREQIIKKEKKEQDAIKAEEESIAKAKIDDGEPMGKRRAAEKAKKVMEKYTSNIQGGSNVCLSCHIEFDNGTLLKDHSCKGSKLDEASDSDVSVKIEGQEESEDDMEGVDSNVSDEEEDLTKRKRQPESVPKITLPFKVKDFSYYLAKSFENFCELHYTSESLFNNWRCDKYTILSEDESAEYLPSLSESCKIRIHQDEWETYKRFEAQKKKDMIIFTGATVRCMQWVPPCIGEEQEQYLSVACFRDADCPRYGKDELPQHPGMLQIWNIGRFTSVPKLTMGLAHDFGTIWAMEWCPSGGRDPEPEETESPLRLGLLAIACSNGSAYILSVPSFHTTTQEEPIICNLKPVAELRLLMNSNHPLSRVRYQATSISWSPQKGHEVVMVGYADGTTALYDLNTTSPFLKATEKGVDIFYPFQDALAENSTITGVALCASGDLRLAVGGQASASVTGATMWGRDRAPVVRSHLAASSVAYTPNWPAALLCSDDALTMKSTNCMEWWGGGRRLGGSCAAGACLQCGRVCLPAPPFVRVLRAHPAYPELKKQIVATLKMVPLARKRKLKLVNDDLGMIVEPLTYDETIKKYGLEFKTLPKKDQKVASKLCDNAEQCAERFPLSEMPSAAFCLSTEHHNRLAVASHAGFVFIITT